MPDPDSRLARWITWIIRELTACVFIFSGFVKAIHPWGTLYKVQDYLMAMHLTLWPNLVIVGVFFLCGIEFMLGAFLATGCFRRGAAVLTLLFMCVMLPLTLWIALFNPVADCGCFGDAFILSNWETFWKNVALTLCALWLVRYNTHCRCIIIPAFQWLALLASASFIVIIEVIGYVYQPLIDFRPYPIGTSLSLTASESDDADEPEFAFIYRKDGVEKEFTMDNLPDEDDGWEFVDRRELLPANTSKATSGAEDTKEFHLWDGDMDVTENVLSDDKDMLILTMPEMGTVSIATVWKINSLYDWAASHDIDMIAVASGSDKEIATWKDLSMPEYTIYTSDDTSIKELVRGNPAVIYADKGIIKWKSALRALDSEDFVTDNPVHDPMNFARDNDKILLYLTYFYIGTMILLIMVSLVPTLRRALLRVSNKKDSKDGN
ncbi:MAG: hypothetical protein K2K97_03005 [Muribaculaceae bacterium]|nr:hypothetical protein [Muribaculaceae bacterium]